jgi:hypothetical protein
MKYVLKDETGRAVSTVQNDANKLQEQLVRQGGNEKGWFISVIHEDSDNSDNTSLQPRQFLTD